MKKESHCKKCNKTKEIKEFYNSNLSTCKECKNKYPEIIQRKINILKI